MSRALDIQINRRIYYSPKDEDTWTEQKVGYVLYAEPRSFTLEDGFGFQVGEYDFFLPADVVADLYQLLKILEE